MARGLQRSDVLMHPEDGDRSKIYRYGEAGLDAARGGRGAMVIRYDGHAEFQLERRGIAKSWVEETVLDPDETETRGGRRSFLKRLPGRRVMLRVVTARGDPEFVITAYFDRTRPCE